jgi:hypothetical protein
MYIVKVGNSFVHEDGTFEQLFPGDLTDMAGRSPEDIAKHLAEGTIEVVPEAAPDAPTAADPAEAKVTDLGLDTSQALDLNRRRRSREGLTGVKSESEERSL